MTKGKNHAIRDSLRYCYSRAYRHNKALVYALPFYIVCSAIASLPLVFIPVIAVTYLEEQKDYGMFALWLAFLLLAYAFLQIIVYILGEKIDWNNTFTRLRLMYRDLNRKCLSCDYEYFDDEGKKKRKSMAQEALSGNWQGCELVLKSFPKILIALLGLIIYISYSGTLNAWMVVLLVGMTASNFLFSYIGCRHYYKHRMDIEASYAASWDFRKIADDVSKGKDIRNYRLQGLFHALFVKNYDLYKKYTRIQKRLLILPNLSNTVFGFLCDLLGYIILTKSVIDGNLSIAAFSSLIGILNGCSTFISDFSTSFNDLLLSSKEVSIYLDFLSVPSSFNHEEGTSIENLAKPVSITFENVSFAYLSVGNKETISSLNFSIKPGEKIALVGENGAGKTTIIKLLSLLYKPTSGRILLDGKDILSFNAEEYRTLLSSVNQDSVLPGIRIDQIVSCRKDPDEERVIKALKEAGLWEKISSLPHKEKTYYSQDLDKEGVLLSGGETQLLMLARALYKDGPILLLDEPTSALDPIKEGEIYRKYASLCEGKTSIFISHRLSSTRFCDRILYLENGQIKEEGTHDELMAKKGSYYEMFEIQAHYYKEEEA